MKINKERIEEKLSLLLTQRERLETLKKENTLEEFLDSWHAQTSTERTIEVVMQIIIDICTHIAAGLKQTPQSYSGCIEVLRNERIISTELSVNLIDAVKMRNLIAHRYEIIDYTRLFSLINKLIKDSEMYKNQILEWLKELE